MDLVPQPYYWPDLSWGNSPPLGTRSGWLSLACMPFVFATASKANWITLLTGVPHEKLQTFHRWTAYAFFVLALMHTFPFIVFHINNHDMVMQVTQMNTFEYWTGIVAIIFQAWLTVASHNFFRKMGYEVFKFSHFFSIVVFVIIFFWHCNATLTSWNYFVATAAVYVPCFVYSWLRTLFEYGGWQEAQVTVEDNDFIRVDIPANFHWVPGQHCFLRFGRFGLRVLSSHPFTICSLPAQSSEDPYKITFYLRHRGGFTNRLYNFAKARPGAMLPVLVDGPYGGIDTQKFLLSDRRVVVAGGSGAGWALPLIELFARKQVADADFDRIADEVDEKPVESTTNASGLQSLRVILATRDTATRVWFRKTVDELLRQYPSMHESPAFSLEVYLTGEAEQLKDSPEVLKDLEQALGQSEAEASSSDDEANLKHPHNEIAGDEGRGRPNVPAVVREEVAKAEAAEKSVGLYVCGPDTMQNDARNAAARANLGVMKHGRGGVYLHLEHFSWA